ncbi:S-adenosyl-L-methionine-dependent methyltransferase [Suillus spraguei]|nr:S-adenosyl-L-methionine-dependent methyltransferase [Suillus spraguei]
MATFSNYSFDSAIYATFRPTYPRSLYDFIFHYHERNEDARWDRAVDLGCGTGQATVELTPFKRVIGVDPSSQMIQVAQETLEKKSILTGQYVYVHGSAERLSFLDDGSVDLVVSAQASHWFDWNKIWPELARVLRKNGSAAFWGYSKFRITRYRHSHKKLTLMSWYDPLNSVGPYWEQPGRSILDNHFVDVPEGNEVVPGAFSEFERVFFTGDHYPSLPSPHSTWSVLHTFRQHNPTDAENPRGDVAVRFWKDLMEDIKQEDGRAMEGHDEVDIEWPLAIILAKRV